MKDKYIKLTLITLSTLLLSACVQVQPKKIHKYSELHTAVRLGQIENVKLLLTKDNIDIRDMYNETPLIDAIRNNETEISFHLICAGAKTEVKDSNNYSLKDMAIRNNNTVILELLTSKNKETLCSKPIKKDKLQNTIKVKKEKPIVKSLNIQKTEKNLFPDNHYQNNFGNITDVNEEEHHDELLTKEELNAYKNDTPQIIKENTKVSTLDKLKTELLLLPVQNNSILDVNKLSFTFYSISKIDSNFTNKLSSFLPSLVKVIKKNQEIIKQIKIKVYTSSEYKNQTTIIGKFMENIKVSEKRAKEIEKIVLTNISNEEEGIKKLFLPIGMSSQNLIKNYDGSENKEKSRRVEFEILTK